MSKKEKFDGRSRPANKAYDEGWDRIFGEKEEKDLRESHEQSKRNREERINDE